MMLQYLIIIYINNLPSTIKKNIYNYDYATWNMMVKLIELNKAEVELKKIATVSLKKAKLE